PRDGDLEEMPGTNGAIGGTKGDDDSLRFARPPRPGPRIRAFRGASGPFRNLVEAGPYERSGGSYGYTKSNRQDPGADRRRRAARARADSQPPGRGSGRRSDRRVFRRKRSGGHDPPTRA